MKKLFLDTGHPSDASLVLFKLSASIKVPAELKERRGEERGGEGREGEGRGGE